MNRATLLIVVAAFASGALGYLASRHLQTPPATPSRADEQSLIGNLAPDFAFPDLEGGIRSLAEFDGQVLVVNFWATWCAPCLREMPALDTLHETLGKRGVTVIGIALDEPSAVADFVAELGVRYPIVIPETIAGMRYVRALGNAAGVLPYTVFIGRDGRVANIKIGALSAEEALAHSSQLL